MALKKDKQKVLGEFFDDERIKTFLEYQPNNGNDPDFHVLEKAYRGMITDNFATFVHFFIEAGRNINANNQYGESFLHTIKNHKQASAYIDILEKADAQ
ncbi:hypothetical protein AB835_06640 [Candidatus Endobugula sertula]|uniref:Aminopeptidase n=1 Tax=Candidatus Endobugula sertula TaxID=62101 RepID=A0A1D2QQQ4_9GAMM|nr:hypothetical protein AB835_06640 [Candidatus Endobugula sertula]